MNNWYQLTGAEVMARLNTSREGLATAAVESLIVRYGRNSLTVRKATDPFIRFLLQFHNLLIYVLLAAGSIAAALGEWVDSGVIVGVVVINAVIGFIQESRAEQALASLKKMLSLRATVIRDGSQQEIAAERLVPGDLVVLTSGDKVPADLRLIQTRNLQVDEAMLTGESLPASKHPDAIQGAAEIGDQCNMAFSGTFVTSGQGRGIVTATGDNTELGKIAGMLQAVDEGKTPLTLRLESFSKALTTVIAAGCTLVYAYGTMLRDYPAMDMFMAAVAIAISAIPEGLPAIMTITLAIGVTRMARRNAIIRKLPAVETLGSTGVICTDKTGTLTRNEMTVTQIITPEGVFGVTGIGFAPTGAFTLEGRQVDTASYPALAGLLRIGMLCGDAVLKRDGAEWKLEGDPTEGALVVAARKSLLDQASEKALTPRTDAIPFEPEQQFMATLHHDHFGNGVIYLKGAPEKILSFCDRIWDGGQEPLDHRLWEDRAHALAAGGLRVLCLACKRVAAGHEILLFSDIEQGGFTLAGLAGMQDPLREEARVAVNNCRRAGIRVKMITGDHAQTARAIAVELGLGDKVRTGVELDQLAGDEFCDAAGGINVFARVNPAHKLKLVQSLQQRGEIVAMTGDGVNDAPALKQADIGIAMGITGTEVAKEAADMVITDDNFASIEQAVEEGRTVFNNLKKTILFILPTNGGECLVVIWAILNGSLLPVLPLHILWINLITTVALAITLAFEPIESNTMQVPPRARDAPFIEPHLIWRIGLVSIIMAVGTYALFYHARAAGYSLSSARTVAVNAVVFFEIFYLFNTRRLTTSVLNIRGLSENKYILIGAVSVMLLQLLFTYTATFNRLFKTEPLAWESWPPILAVTVLIFFIVELEKVFIKNHTHHTRG
jgi:magnesium-transporting ATPase (P-type)